MSKLDSAKKKLWDLTLSKLNRKSYIYGGAVRDHIAGQTYNDLDVFFFTEYERNRFMGQMQLAGATFKQVELPFADRIEEYGMPDLERYMVTLDGQEIQMDLVTRGNHASDPFGSSLDLDVNGLGMGSDGKIFKAASNMLSSVEQVKENIAKKHFIPQSKDLPPARASKIESLKEKGWQAVCRHIDFWEETIGIGDVVWVYVYDNINDKYLTVKGKIVSAHFGVFCSRNKAQERVPDHIDVITDNGKKYSHVYQSSILGRAIEPVAKPVTANNSQGESDMPTNSFMDHIKKDIKTGGYRAAAKTIPKTARAGLLAFMKAKKAPKGWIKTAKEMMETEWGLAFIQQVLAWGFRYFPMLKDDPRAQALANEWGADSWAIIGNEVVDELMGAMAPVIAQVMDLPMPPQVRVQGVNAESSDAAAEDEAEAEDEAVRRVA